MTGNSADKTQLSLIFANIAEQDILLRDELDRMAQHKQFKRFYVLEKVRSVFVVVCVVIVRSSSSSFIAFIFTVFNLLTASVCLSAQPPAEWDGGKGFVSQDHIRAQLPAPGADTKILLCGPPPMCDAMEKHLAALGYTKEMIFRY